jgi:hypothetical protein
MKPIHIRRGVRVTAGERRNGSHEKNGNNNDE